MVDHGCESRPYVDPPTMSAPWPTNGIDVVREVKPAFTNAVVPQELPSKSVRP